MAASSSPLKAHQNALIQSAMKVDSLKFGSFTLKSGRTSPYFFNAGLLSSGPILHALATAYASTIVEANFGDFDVLFGPAYKGIPFAATTVMQLYSQHNMDVGFAYDRKEAKDHGEGGNMVGVPVSGKRVVILDDVMTAGTAIRQSIDLIRKNGGDVVGVVQCLDREEVGKDGVSSTVKDIEALIGVGRVHSILKMRDLMVWLDSNGMGDVKERMREYWEQYGIKE